MGLLVLNTQDMCNLEPLMSEEGLELEPDEEI